MLFFKKGNSFQGEKNRAVIEGQRFPLATISKTLSYIIILSLEMKGKTKQEKTFLHLQFPVYYLNIPCNLKS